MWGSVNVPGGSTQGLDGKSAYEVAIANGFSGTEAQWLESLKGETGATGATGGIGATGATGPAGPGLPPGGTAGQVPVKVDETDYNTQWKKLTAYDVGAASSSHGHSDYLTKQDPTFNGLLKSGDNSAIQIGSDNSGGAGHYIGYRQFANLGFAVGSSSVIGDRDTIVKVTSQTVDSNGNIICTVTGASSSFWAALEKVSRKAVYCLVTNGRGERTTQVVNVSIIAFDKSASTVTLQGFTDFTYHYLACNIGSTPTNFMDAWFSFGEYNFLFKNSSYAGSAIAIGNKIDIVGARIICIGRNLSVSASSTHYQDVVLGRFNKTTESGSDVVAVGGGSGENSRANCFRITTSGVYANGSYNATGADYAELFEWLDGNPRNEDRIGLFVTLDGEKVRLAGPGDDFILGVVSGNPSVVGDAYDDQWQGMYATDIFCRFIYEDAVIPAEYDEDGNLISEEHTETRLKINPAYNADEPYVPRSQRREWVTVGMMGKLTVIDDGTCQVNGWCTSGAGGVATASESRTKYRVMSRLDGNHVRVLIL